MPKRYRITYEGVAEELHNSLRILTSTGYQYIPLNDKHFTITMLINFRDGDIVRLLNDPLRLRYRLGGRWYDYAHTAVGVPDETYAACMYNKQAEFVIRGPE